MSQRKDTMPVVARESGAMDRLLRPLCAKNLPPTLPEREGWVNRDQLYDFSGRTRKPQMALAAKFGFSDYASPAGGCCFLTDEAYSRKLVDLWQARGKREYELDDIMLLKVGRHLRPRPHFKIIVGREEGENNFLEGYRKQYLHIRPISHPGPLVLVDGEVTEDDIQLAARITARYSKGQSADAVTVRVTDLQGGSREFDVQPLPPSEVQENWHL